jgi:hypothetical protein
MPALKKTLEFSIFTTFAVCMLVGFASLLSFNSPKAYAGSPTASCSQGFHRSGSRCVKTDQDHPVDRADVNCKSDQTPTQITSGPDNGKWYCKDSPASPSPSSPSSDPTTPCNLTSGCDLIETYVNPFINLLSIAFGLIAVISIILGGIQYSASQGDPQKASQAKSRISNTMIAIFAYLFLYAFLQFLIPGGLFH